MVDITALYYNFVTYIFGDSTIAALAFLFIVTMVGIRYKWSFESYIVVFMPTMLLIVNKFAGLPGLEPLMLMGVGVVIGFGLLAVIRR